MNVLEIRHLRLLLAIAEEGSLTAAARQLHLTQSALSHQLRDAEEKLETRLFHRVNKRLVATPAGEQALAAARKVLQDLQEVEAAIRQGRASGQHTLRLATECYTCYHWLPQVLARFRKTHPKVEVRIDLASTDQPLLALREGRLDLAIVYSDPSSEEFRVVPLFLDEMVVMLSPRHRLAKRSAIQPTDFAGETLYVYPPKSDNLLLRRVLKPVGVEPTVYEVPLTEAIVELVSSGLGIAFLARWAVEPHLKAGTIVTRPLSKKWRRTWKAAFLGQADLPVYTRDFLRMLREQRGIRPPA
jgi:LysR family transcriptional regulator for metE and metH